MTNLFLVCFQLYRKHFGNMVKLMQSDQIQLGNISSALIQALSDYSTDQRGDVGSWIRVASLNGLGGMMSHLSRDHLARAELSDQQSGLPISQAQFELAMTGVVKLLVEKLEPVRAAAARCWGLMRQAGAEQVWTWVEGRLVDVDLQEP